MCMLQLIIAVKKSQDTGMLPLECPYLSRSAMQSIAGQQPLPVKHFALKRKPKSAALRADLLQKCKVAFYCYVCFLVDNYIRFE